ncbi:MAG TPA: sprT domain-containing protein [Bacteroidia bacterium]|nr:sprT domain-containing protein [Bacteroidia bacterium]
MSHEAISAVLSKYLPPASVEECTSWVIRKNIHLKITRGRSSKFGDYQPLGPGKGHRITVNHDLNKYAFLITFVHEVAHLHCFEKFHRRHEPHGVEWKNEFRLLLLPFVSGGMFPDDVRGALSKYLHNPSASSCTDHDLMRALKKHDTLKLQPVIHLEELPEKTVFRIHQSRSDLTFLKGQRRRTRYQCLELKTKRIYFVNALTEVTVIGQQ